MLCSSHFKIWNLANHMKKQNKKHQNAICIREKLKTKGLMFFVSFFSCDLQDFWYENHKAFGATFLYWVDFNLHIRLSLKDSKSSMAKWTYVFSSTNHGMLHNVALWCEIFDFFLLSFPQNERKYISFAQFVYFLREVCLLFDIWKIKFTITVRASLKPTLD